MDRKRLTFIPSIQSNYDSDENVKKTVVYLGKKDEIFWDYMNLTVYTHKIIEECNDLDYPKNAMNYLFLKFINHIATSYNLLTRNMQEEFFIMLRQSFEVLWLLKYLVKYPNKEKEWIMKSFPKEGCTKITGIHPSEVRKGFPEDKEAMQYIYDNLSNFAHANFIAVMNGIGIGGFYDERFIDLGISNTVVAIHDMLELHYEILEAEPNKYLVSDYKKLYIVNNNLIKGSHLKEKLINSIESYRELVPGLWKLQITRDYEQEALEKLITQGYLKVK